MLFDTAELLFCLSLLFLGIYGIYRTGAWRKPLFLAFFFAFPVLAGEIPMLAYPECPLWGKIAIALAVYFAANALVFRVKRDEAFRFPELASVFLFLATLAVLWRGWLLYLLILCLMQYRY